MFVFMNNSNNIKIIFTAFILVGLGLGSTSPLYKSAFEEISPDKNGIASGVLNSLRQLAACLAIALVSTLSSHYTTQAIDNTKIRMLNTVNNNTVLEQQVKTTMTDKIKASNTSKSTGFTREMADKLIQAQEASVLKAVPDNMKPSVKEKFNIQAQEVYNIIDESKTIKNDESNKVYNKCFTFTAIIAVLGLIAVPFNKKSENELEKVEVKIVV